MPEYAQIDFEIMQIIDGPRALPTSIKTDNGWITGFDCLDDETVKQYGWIPVEYAVLTDIQTYDDPTIDEDKVTYPAMAVPTSVLAARAKITRNAEVNANILLLNVEWQVGVLARTNIGDTINGAEYLGTAVDATVEWILADNSTRDTTVAELKQVFAAYCTRMMAVYQQFNAWRSGDQTAAFEYVIEWV